MPEKIKCEKCGAEMIPLDPNKPIGMECPECGWGWVTSYIEPKYEDETVYSITLEQGNDINKTILKAISQIKNCNFIEAKNLIENPNKALTEGRAMEIDKVVQILEQASVKYSIELEWPY